MYWILFYDLAADYLDRRPPLRGRHLDEVRAAHERGELLIAGALADPADGAVLVFKGESAAPAERFARTDPYVQSGLVTDWRVRAWTVVIGDGVTPPT